jgi:SAM-dependent methyltransferase
MTEALQEYLGIWERKPVLRAVYDDFYDRIAELCGPGLTVEIGGGVGNLKHKLSHVVATDIQFAPWLDCVANAQDLPFADRVVANIVMVDVLHHVEYPVRFFREAERLLKPGGKIIMVEPAITWGSTLFYRLLHHEPVRMSADPLLEGMPDPNRDPYDSNQAIPTLIATKMRQRFIGMFPNLAISRVDWFSFVVYPLSGGFKPWSLVPTGLTRPLLAIERAVEPWLGRWLGFRMVMVVEKATASKND